MLKNENLHKLYLLFCICIIGFAIICGLYSNGSIHFTNLKTFTYQSNIFLVLGYVVIIALYNKSHTLRHYISISVLVAISVTGLIYNFVLVPIVDAPPVNIGFVNFALHALSMVLALVNYFVFEQKGNYRRMHVIVAMAFPAIYWLVFVSIGGRIDYYPYFFMNPMEIGWLMVFIWLVILLGSFAVLGALLVWFDTRHSRKVDTE